MDKFDKLTAYDTFRWERIKGAELCGKYDFPKLKPCTNAKPQNLIPFHMTKNAADASERWFHFFIDDYQFERIWNRPDRYLPILKRFQGGISTDFSMYLDMPKSQQIWNCWRNRAMAYWMQESGLNIIPNACWGDEDSLDWAFDGLPENSILAFTSQGCMKRNDESKRVLVNGIHRLIRDKMPIALYVYGSFPEAWKERFSVPIFPMKTFSEETWRVG